MYLQFGWNANTIKLSFVSENPGGMILLLFTLNLFLISFTVLAGNIADCRPTDIAKLNSEYLETDL